MGGKETKPTRSSADDEAAQAEQLAKEEAEHLQPHQPAGGTIAGRATSLLGAHAEDERKEEHTGSPGADADREQAEERDDGKPR
jgi:hypothetical protein